MRTPRYTLRRSYPQPPQPPKLRARRAFQAGQSLFKSEILPISSYALFRDLNGSSVPLEKRLAALEVLEVIAQGEHTERQRILTVLRTFMLQTNEPETLRTRARDIIESFQFE